MSRSFSKSLITQDDKESVEAADFHAPAKPAETVVGVPGWVKHVSADEVMVWEPLVSKPSVNASVPAEFPLTSQASPEPSFDNHVLEEAADHFDKAYTDAFESGLKDGYQEGFDKGRSEAQELAEQAVQGQLDEIKQTADALADAMAQVVTMRKQLASELEADAVHLALVLAKKLAGEALLQDDSWIEPLVREAAAALTEDDRIVCSLSPELADRLQRAGGELTNQGITLDIRPNLGPLELQVESRFGRVDAGFEERLDHLRRAVLEQIEQAVPEQEDT